VLFPRAPGVFTAMGMLAGRVERYFIRVVHQLLGTLDPLAIEQAMASLKAEAALALHDEGYGEDRISHEFELDMRYRGQDSEIQIPLDDAALDAAGLRDRFLNVYRATYGYVSSDEVEIVNLRLRAFGIGKTKLDFRAIRAEQLSGAGATPAGTRPIFFDRDSGWDRNTGDRSHRADRATARPAGAAEPRHHDRRPAGGRGAGRRGG
jgi:N-methylhydantoinase A